MNLGRFRLVTQLGAGCDGLSFRAVDDKTGRPCEVRDLGAARANAERWQKAVHRLRVAFLLRHPRQLKVLDLHLEHEPPFVALEETSAPFLADVRDEELPWAPAQVTRLAGELIGVLAAAHRLGLAHGNLRPSTLRWLPGHGVKIDLTGVECLTPRPSPIDPACLAPELRGSVTPDPAADMYALGAILSWLLRGRPAVPDARIVSEFPDLTGQAPLLTTVEGLLRSDPNERPSAPTLLDELFYAHSATECHEREEAPDGFQATRLAEGRLAEGRLGEALPRIDPAIVCNPQKLGRFLIHELLGEGGLGRVYRAEDMTDGTPAAVKVLHPHLAERPGVVKRFQKEARLLGEVQSPYVANILEVNQDGAIHYLALEFIAGLSLASVLKDRSLCPQGRLPEPLAIGLVIDVARALADAHRRGIIHRDIKPQNIMVVRDSWLMRALVNAGQEMRPAKETADAGSKLCDFGLARHVVESDSLHLTQEGATVGTPLYMSPEQAAGLPNLGPATDVYALGATLYHLLAGRPPFRADTALALSLQHTKETAPPLTQFQANLSDGMCRIVAKCLAKKPQDRYADAETLLEELERLERGEPATMVIHPRVPEGKNVLDYCWTWELESSPEELWPYVSDTERLNRAAGIPAVEFTTDETGAVSKSEGIPAPLKRHGSFRKAGVMNTWREHPFEWVEGKRMGVLREYSQGILKWLASTTELTPRPQGGTTLRHQVRVEPRNFFGALAARLEVGYRGRRSLERVYRRIDAYLRGKLAGPQEIDPFEPSVTLSRAQQRQLAQQLTRLLENNVPEAVVGALGDFLEHASDQDVARIRPLALARRLGINDDALVAACLHGARNGLLVLMWDILCPLCRIPSGIVDTLKSLKEHAHCPACQSEFDVDFAKSVEMIFRVHAEIRACETKTYCIGGPAHSPHVVAQVRIAAGERFDLDLALAEGAYRIRGPQLARAYDFQVEPGAFRSRLALQVPGDFQRSQERDWAPADTRLRAGQQRLVFQNDHKEELVLRVERTAQREDALTAARAASSWLFRELFPGEILEAGKLVSVAAVTLLVLDLDQATNLDRVDNLYAALGEARTFGLLHDYLRRIEEATRREGGAVIKTLGETVLAAFQDKAAAVRAGLTLAQRLPRELGQHWPALACPLQVRAGIHHGPAMSATVNGALDYVGTTVDQSLRLPTFTSGGHLVLSRAVASDVRVVELLASANLKPEVLNANLPGQSFGVLVSVRVPT